MITRPGGYCPMCDTVYDEPHECGVLKSVGKQLSREEQATFKTAGAIGIWNAAIEAAALIADEVSFNASHNIRKLKK